MKTNLLQLRKQLTFIIMLFISALIFGQTLVNYPLDNNLNPNPAPITGVNPSLKYFDPPSTIPINNPNYYFGYLDFANSGDFLELSFDVAANEDIRLQVNAGTAVLLSKITGKIQIYYQVDNGPSNLLSQQNLNADATGFLQFYDVTDISFDIALVPTAAPARIKIKIVGVFTSSGINVDYFGIDNISLVKETTSISVISTKSPTPLFINHLDGASVTRDTDFGSLLTNEGELEKTFQIKNTGTRDLKINSIDVNPNNQGFIVTGPLLTTVSPNGTTTFKVKFAPTNQGFSTSEVFISGNIIPNNPFRFEVKGSGKSCNLTPVPIASYGFEGAAPSNMPVTPAGGTFKLISGTSVVNAPSLGTLYPTGNLYSAESPTRSWYIRGTDTNAVTVEFGPVDITNQQEVSINFDVAAFGTTINNNSGVNSSDYVILQVFNGSTWIDALRLNGANDGTRRKYAYGASETVTKPANDLYVPTTLSNNTSGNNKNYGRFSLNLPSSALSAAFKFRIMAYASRTRISGTNYNYNLWLIDNVHVDAGNAKVKTWNGIAWDGDTTRPSSREKALFTGTYDFTGAETDDLSVCECEVNSGVNLTIPTLKSLSVRNKINNHDLTGSNFKVENDANLLQIENGIVNADNINVKRVIKVGAARNQYNYLGTPVNFAPGESFKTIYPNTTYVLYHNEANNIFYNSSGVNIPGRGLAVKEPTGTGATTVTASFKGIPQNGNIAIGITNKDTNVNVFGFNLVGNPYASNIDLLKLYEVNGGKTGSAPTPSPNISATFYFWDNNGNDIFTQQGSGYLGQSYAIFNVLAGSNGSGTNAGSGIKVPTNIVKVGQGFMTRSLRANYNLNFNNSIRTNTASATDFLGKGETSVQDDRYWLKMAAPSGITSTVAIVHYPAGNNLFGAEDSRFMGGSDVIYSMAEDEKLAINGRSSLVTTDMIPLGTKHFVDGQYTISVDTAQGIFANGQSIYLKDRQTGIITNLSLGTYTFAALAGESTGRFEIIYQPENVLSTDSTVKENIIVYRDGTDFIVKADSKKITALDVYDSVGRLIYSLKPNAVKVTVPTEGMLSGVYILKIDQGGKITSKKVIR